MKSILCILLSFFCQNLSAQQLTINDGYLRATPPGQMMSSAFMKLTNNSDQTIIITGGESSKVKAIEIHNNAMRDGMMSMEHIPQLRIAAGKSITMAPGGLNFMFIGLHKALVAGETFSFDLVFENGERQSLTLPIKSIVN